MSETLTDAEWHAPLTVRRGEWHTLQNANGELRAEILKLTKQLEEARAKAVEECIEIGIASCKFTAEQRKAMRSADIIYWQHSICADMAIMEVVEKCRNLLAGMTAPSETRIVTSHALPVAMWGHIATAVVKRVAELPDRSSPEDWPDAMLVTGEELHRIIMSEFDAEIG